MAMGLSVREGCAVGFAVRRSRCLAPPSVVLLKGFDAERCALPTKQLSGGWRMRVALGCGLLARPGLLLLVRWMGERCLRH